MTEPARCPKCHAELPANAPQGLCPQCLLQAAFDSQSAAAAADPATDPTRLTSSGFVPPSPAALGRLFPQLEILELLGRGGMGAVYKARQKGLDRLVAVKILPPEVGNDPAFAERFTREAKALARLNHPSIVTIHDVGQADGLYFFVMEFVDGLNLRQLIERRELSSEQALAIVPQICEALQYAHDEGIVHRDIKPENILLDKRGRVKIADFGLAKLLGHESVDASLTGTQQVMGTLRYMAPEQMRGARQVDHRADIYSLGVVFYELLTGELPIGRFAPPSKKVQIDVRLDEIVLRALEAEPEQRYQHASDVKTEIDAIRTTPAQPRTTAERRDPPDGFREMARVAMTPNDLPQGTITFLLLKLFLIAGVVLALTHVGQIMLWTKENTGYVYEAGVLKNIIAPDPADRPLSTFIWIDVLVASAVCFFVGRAAWRKGVETGTGAVPLPVDGVPLIRRQLKGPAIALMLYGLIVLFPAVLCFTNGFDIADGNDATPAATGFGLMALSFLLLGLAGLIIRGGWHMLAVESYGAALLASFLGQPIGLWGLFVLSRPDVKAAFPVASQFRSEPRFSRFAIAGAVWALFGLLSIVPILFFIGLNRVWNGTALPTDMIYAEPPVAFTIFMGVLLAIGAGALIGTTIFGAVSIGHIKRSGGKIVGLPLAVADTIFFPLLLLAGMAGFVAMLIVLTAIQWGIDPRLFDKNDLPHLLIVVMAVPIWFFPARALWRAVVGPRDAFQLGKLPLVGNEPLTGQGALVLALAAIVAHAWPWHWIISPPSPRSMTISNFDVIDALQSVGLLSLSLGASLFASAATLARPARTILRIGSVLAALVALVIQVQFFRSLGEFEPGRIEKIVRLTRTYSHMGVYVTMALTGLTILFFVLRLFEEKSEPPDSQARTESDDAQNSEPRLSRLALWGAIWGGLGLLGLIVAVFLTSLHTSGPSGQASAPPESLRILGLVVVSVAVALGASSVFGATICGAVAIGQIKHSGGKLYGLPLAAADALLFPLLIVGFAASAVTHIAQIAIWTKTHTGYVYKAGIVVDIIAPNPANRPDMMFLILDTLAALVVCFFVGRAVWRAVTRHDRVAAVESSGDSQLPVVGSPTRPQPPMAVSITWPQLPAWYGWVFGAGFPAAVVVTVAIFVWFDMNPSSQPGAEVEEKIEKTADATGSVSGTPASPTGWSVGSGWIMGSGGPALTDSFARIVLKLQPAQIEQVNAILQAIYAEYPALEAQHTEQHVDDAGHIVVRINPFPGPIAELEDRLWSQLDAILDPQQQSVARNNLKLDPPEVQPPFLLSELVRPGFFGWGKQGAYLEIWRVGTWYHWKIQSRGHQDSSHAPQLPEGYRRFWKEPKADDATKVE